LKFNVIVNYIQKRRKTMVSRGNWGSRIGFILAAAGSAIGLGNIWRFPYVTGENGGAIFILIYIICVVMLGLPIMLAEFSIGRNTQRNPVGAFKSLKPGTPWFFLGGFGVLAGFMILSYYAVIAGYTLGYVIESLRGVLSGATEQQIGAHFEQFTNNPLTAIGYFIAIMFLTMFIVSKGIKGGIERYSKILMPALFIMLLMIIVRSVTLPGSAEGLKFIFWPNLEKIDASIMLRALGQAFFSMSLGMGAMLTYGSYLNRKENLPKSSVFVGGLDLLIALLAGIALFPALFSVGASPDAGPGLAFVTFPLIFNKIPFGTIIMPIFFMLLVVAALTSTISLMEVISSYFIDEKRWSRRKAVTLMGFCIIILGIPLTLSTDKGVLTQTLGFNIEKLIEHISADYMLPIGAFFTSIFVGFIWKKTKVVQEVKEGSKGFPLVNVWIIIVRWVAPFIIGQIILLGFLSEFKTLESFVADLNKILSIVDAVIILILILGTVVYLVAKKKEGPQEKTLSQEE
jgi:NSS family neurotransmitter:Na+ symporter